MDEFTEEGLRFKHYGTRDWNEASDLKDTEESVPLEWYYDPSKYPYYAPGPHDPPLPTPEEIENAPQPHERKDFHNFEAEAMLFLEQHPVLHMPKLYAAFVHQGADPLKLGYRANGEEPPPLYYIIMEYIQGDTFHKAWPLMTVPERKEICNRIGSHLRELRSIPQPKESPTKEPYYGRVGYQRVVSISGMFGDPRRPLSGPYDSYEEVVEDMASTAEKDAVTIVVGGGWDEERAEKLKQFRPTLLAAKPEDRRIVFTHHDLKLSNIILRPRNREVTQKKADKDTPYGTNYDVVFIDWEMADWMPGFTELWSAYQASSEALKDPAERDLFLKWVFETIGPHNWEIPEFLWSCIGPFFYRYC
ncbi:kinase-like protein [Periconia macrospinosa]|uniref:Kinase-like protein n=1 Tax=Periconia macrospinosa TaxID=97972 RepID=A0A2V1DWU4_9PLEO|nr:kinase-like protein [Periconia macrospinosa]